MFQTSSSKISETSNLLQDDFVETPRETQICNSSVSDSQEKQDSNFTFDENILDEENSISLDNGQTFQYFMKSEDSSVESYLEYNPNQPSDVPGGLPFAPRKVYFTKTNDKR